MHISLAASAKTTERSLDARVLSRDLLKKRNLLLTLLVIAIMFNIITEPICLLGIRNRTLRDFSQSTRSCRTSIRSGYTSHLRELETIRYESNHQQSLARVWPSSLVHFTRFSRLSLLYVCHLIFSLKIE